MKLFIRFILVAFPLFLSACSTQHIAQPRVSLVDVEMADVSVFETSLLIKVRIQNTDPKPLRIAGGSHEVFLNGLSLGSGESGEDLTIPGHGSVTDTVRFYISNFTLFGKIQRLVNSSHLDYKIKSRLYVDSSLFGRTLEVDRQGELWQNGSL